LPPEEVCGDRFEACLVIRWKLPGIRTAKNWTCGDSRVCEWPRRLLAHSPASVYSDGCRLSDQLVAMNVEAIVRWGKDHTFGLEFLAVSQSAESRLKKFLSRSPKVFS
jgi:hypothetical protein